MTLPKGWRTGGYAALATPVAVCAGAGLAAVLAVGYLRPGASRAADDSMLLLIAILVAGACGLAAFLALRALTDAMEMARTLRPLGVDDAARAVGAYLGRERIAHAEDGTDGRPSGRVYRLGDGRVRIELEAVEPRLTWVLVGPVPEGDDPAFRELLAGLKDALDRMELKSAR